MLRYVPITRLRLFIRLRSSCLLGAKLALCILPLCACATYERSPAPERVQLARSVADMGVSPHSRLSMPDIDSLVLSNNPDLIAARLQLGVAAAQVKQAGILPNPQVSTSYPFLISGPGSFNSFTAGLSQDVKSLITYTAKVGAARADGLKVNASLIWQEWQTLGKARLLFVQIVEGERLASLMGEARAVLSERYRLTSRALGEGNATIATLSPDLVALGDIEKVRADLERQQVVRKHQLNALIGLAPEARLPLARSIVLPPIASARVRAELASLSDRRPDLIALQFGLASSEEKLRGAILGQFPNLSLGLTGGSDTSAVGTLGPQATVDLPLFDRNQGNIAIDRATRAQLTAEYAARLTAAEGEVRSLLIERSTVLSQIRALQPRIAEARDIAAKAAEALSSRNLDERSYVDLLNARLAREQEGIALEQTAQEAEISLATLLGLGMPPVSIPPELSPEPSPLPELSK